MSDFTSISGSLLTAATIAGGTYASITGNLALINAKIELSKVQLERERLYTPEERTLRFHAERVDADKKAFYSGMDSLRRDLIEWSHNRCSPITHHSVADRAETRIMASAHEIAGKNTDSLRSVFDSQISVCGTSDQYKFIYSWINKVLQNH